MRRHRKQATTVPGGPFPGYADVTEIGSGAFAAVYRATELSTNRPVALKLLKVSARLPHVMEAFDREVKALGSLSSHPNIVTLYRTLTTPDDRPVLVLELCKESVADRVRREGPLPVREAVAIGIKIAGALETAHRAGLLHRDMKPQNILITQYREPALADFGVAALQASAQSTEGVFGFTTLHAPPEVLEGQRLSPATDVYGLASTVYQMVAGRAPFSAFDGEAPASVILRILRDPVAPLREDIPLVLADTLVNALSKRPEERPLSGAAFAEALRRVEDACGWAPTAYAVWGDDPDPVGAPAERYRAAPLEGLPSRPAPAGGAVDGSPPVVATPAGSGGAPRPAPVITAPPHLPPPAPPRPEPAAPPRPEPAATPVAAAPADGPPSVGAPAAGPLFSAAGAAPGEGLRRASVATPAPAVRNVVAPSPTHPPAPLPPPPRPIPNAGVVAPGPAPLPPAPAGPRPVFIDPPQIAPPAPVAPAPPLAAQLAPPASRPPIVPPPASRPPAPEWVAPPTAATGRTESVYERTVTPAGLIAALQTGEPSPAPVVATGGRRGPLAAAGAGVALVVVALIVLLLTGVL